ncbi:hypothetical protein SADUNF_Sadunf16G0177700 [Salix dunnii]|uniref:Uncharacterized protein n=1 Tax=Salix dunnii TaxID=1413687 RepID=A0A835JBR7_9ROSI|nr:hypothetical protein SADUNF_Sadunf16G0177700 [Salix dunnii]
MSDLVKFYLLNFCQMSGKWYDGYGRVFITVKLWPYLIINLTFPGPTGRRSIYILSSNDDAFLAQTKAMKAQAAGPRAAPVPLALDDDKI